jgi:gamma-glutamyltranspeptidase/glutathione hydrolase
MDAALQAAVTLAVVYPHMCGVGGDLFALAQRDDGETLAIASSGRAPRTADANLVTGLAEMPIRGPIPITVPGAVAGWRQLHEVGAILPWEDAFASAIGFADDGMAVSRSLAGTLSDPAHVEDPGLSVIFSTGKPAGREGAIVRQPALATTLRALAAQGPSALYGGSVGADYVHGLRQAGSAITLEDLREHRALVLSPLRTAFGDRHLSVVPPTSQGFVLLQILALIDRLGIDPNPDGPDAGVIAHIFDAASRDRDRHLADPDHMLVHPSTLLDDGHLAAQAEEVRGAARMSAAHPDGDTIALVTADAQGNAVSLIQSLFWGFGSGILEPSTGIVAQNRGACFSTDPTHPNAFAPGKLPAHTLMPALVHDDRGLVAVAGTMGGYFQPQINAHTIIRSVVLGADPADAVSAPRWLALGTEAPEPEPLVSVEAGVPSSVATSIQRAGYTVRPASEEDSFGHAHVITRTAQGFSAGSDPRADGAAAAG